MHQLDAFPFDHIDQALNVPVHDDGVFGGQGQLDMFGATPFQFHHLATAFRGHDGRLAGQHQGLGHVNGAAFDPAPAHIEGRQNLKHHRKTRGCLLTCGLGLSLRVRSGARICHLVHPAGLSVPMVSTDISPDFITAADGTRLAFCATAATRPDAGPGIVFLGGFMSDMTGQKATVLEGWARKTGRGFLRLDYSGHGASGGAFQDGTIGRWRDDALTIIQHTASEYAGLRGDLVLVGSSMGGWIATLVAKALAGTAGSQQVAGLVTIAAAADFTEDLLPRRLGPDALETIATQGYFEAPSEYSSGPYVITGRLLEEGRNHLVLPGPLALDVPVRLIHGTADPDVPWTQSQKLMAALTSCDVELILVKDGDHRLSEPHDLERLVQVVARLCDQLSASNAASPAR